MLVVKEISAIRQHINEGRTAGHKIALVPTMGFLHRGHLSLVREARKQAELVIVSIFLNPTQFNDPSDFEKYPRDIKTDLELLHSEKTGIVFCPDTTEIYAEGFDSWVSVDGLAAIHEGEFRPGHFRGVTTVVNILFNIIRPDYAFFGEKDFQQLALIRKMAHDLRMDLQIIGCQTIRESDGLALSSRNARLSASARKAAPCLYKGLSYGRELFRAGLCNPQELEEKIAADILKNSAIKIEYIRIIDPITFERKKSAGTGDRIILAAWIDGIRLIDNIAL